MEEEDISFTRKVVRKAERTGVTGVLVASGWSGSMYLVLVKLEEGNMEFKDVCFKVMGSEEIFSRTFDECMDGRYL